MPILILDQDRDIPCVIDNGSGFEMSAMEKACEFETTWLRAYAETFRPTEAPFRFSPDDLRRANLTILDIVVGMREGLVVAADKLDGPGALWTVIHVDEQGRLIEFDIVVESEVQRVSLHRVCA